jgi:hypothetical protein
MIEEITAGTTDPGEVLAFALGRAAQHLGLSGACLARVIGLSRPVASRILKGERPLPSGSKSGELAQLLLRVNQLVDAVVGSEGPPHQLDAQPQQSTARHSGPTR